MRRFCLRSGFAHSGVIGVGYLVVIRLCCKWKRRFTRDGSVRPVGLLENIILLTMSLVVLDWE